MSLKGYRKEIEADEVEMGPEIRRRKSGGAAKRQEEEVDRNTTCDSVNTSAVFQSKPSVHVINRCYAAMAIQPGRRQRAKRRAASSKFQRDLKICLGLVIIVLGFTYEYFRPFRNIVDSSFFAINDILGYGEWWKYNNSADVDPYSFQLELVPDRAGNDANFELPVRYLEIRIAPKDPPSASWSPPSQLLQFLDSSSLRVSLRRMPSGESVGARADIIDRHDGTFLLRYRLSQGVAAREKLKIRVFYDGNFPGKKFVLEPLDIEYEGPIFEENCDCPADNANRWLEAIECPADIPEIDKALSFFPVINLQKLREEGPRMVKSDWRRRTLIHYTIKNNELHRRAFGPLPSFQTFTDDILGSLIRKVPLPDVEFMMNLGDWPIEARLDEPTAQPIFAWAGATDHLDIMLPTWEITKSLMGELDTVSPALLEFQGGEASMVPWNKRIEKGFFRGRDSNKRRVDLIEMAFEGKQKNKAKLDRLEKENIHQGSSKRIELDASEDEDLFDVAINSWERTENLSAKEKYGGGRSSRIGMTRFFRYKYQINIDGSVAAFRLPYLFFGGSTVFKQQSDSLEWYHGRLKPWQHYIPFKEDLSDLRDQIRWARANDATVKEIAKEGRKFAMDNLMPHNIFCYYYRILTAYAARQVGTPTVFDDMVEPLEKPLSSCKCSRGKKKVDSDGKLLDGTESIKMVTTQTFKSDVLESNKDVLLMVFSNWCPHCKELIPAFREVSEKFSDKSDIVAASMDGQRNVPFNEDFKWKSLPTIWLIKKASQRPITMEAEHTRENLAKFVEDNASTPISLGIKKIWRSELPPERNDEPVRVVVRNTFKENVLDSGKDVLLKIYAPWCGHCQDMAPGYERLARKASAFSDSLIIAKMDGTRNDPYNVDFEWKHYPTIFFLKKGMKMPIVYEGDKNVRSLARFITRNTTQSIKIELDPQDLKLRSQETPKFQDLKLKQVVTDTFEEMILQNDKDIMLQVYAPWCGHCQKLEPVWVQFAEEVANHYSNAVMVAKMDGTENEPFNEDFHWTGFPTVWFIGKNEKKPLKYRGPRTVESFLTFLAEQISTASRVTAVKEEIGEVKSITTEAFKQHFMGNNQDTLMMIYAPWCGHCKKMEPIYSEFASRVKEEKSLMVAKMDGTENEAWNDDFKWTGFPTIWMIKKGSRKPIKFQGERSMKGLARFVEENSSSSIKIPLTNDEAKPKTAPAPQSNNDVVKVVVTDQFQELVIDSDKDVLIYVYKPDCRSCLNYEKLIAELAQLLPPHGSLILGKIDGSENEPIDETYRWTKYPTIMLVVGGSRQPFIYAGEPRLPELVSFIEKFSSSKSLNVVDPSKSAIKSEDEPAPASGAVKSVVGKTFRRMVLQNDKDTLLLVYATQCDYCKEFLPVYEKFGEFVSEKFPNHLSVLKMDGVANDPGHYNFKWNAYPTIYLIRRGSTHPIEFEGDRTVQALLDFWKTHTTSSPDYAFAKIEEL